MIRKEGACGLLACCALTATACTRPTSPPPAATTASGQPSLSAPPLRAAVPDATTATPTAATSIAGAQASQTSVSFDGDAVGGPPSAFEGVVGEWHIAEVGGARGLEIDGAKWHDGTASATLPDQAKRLYGERSAEFVAGVKAFAFFPFAVYGGPAPAAHCRVSVRFFAVAGRIDQAAGIAFAIAPNGSYLGVRVNALEDNLLFFRVVKGRRSILDEVGNVPTAKQTWHTLTLELRDKELSASLDGHQRFQKTLDSAPVGRIGLWSKADSQVVFDDFKVEALSALPAHE